MKNKMKSVLLWMLCLCSTGIMAQGTSVMFLDQVLNPLPGHSYALEEGVKAHNAKFHASGEDKANLFAIMTGPRSGQYAWIQGPVSYAALDKPLSKEHKMDWDKNVGAHCSNAGELRLMKRSEALTYNPANEVIAENYLARIFYGISDQAQLLEAIGMIKKLYEANKVTTARRVYTSEFRTKEGEDVVLVYPFKSFTEFQNHKGLPFDDLPKEMDKVHGTGAMAKFQAMMEKASAGWYDEVRTMVK